jgi:hypothetical protein
LAPVVLRLESGIVQQSAGHEESAFLVAAVEEPTMALGLSVHLVLAEAAVVVQTAPHLQQTP